MCVDSSSCASCVRASCHRNAKTTTNDDGGKAVDLYVFERALAATHGAVAAELTAEALRAYTACSRGGGEAVLHRLAQVCHGVSWWVMVCHGVSWCVDTGVWTPVCVCGHRCVDTGVWTQVRWLEVRIERHERHEREERETSDARGGVGVA